MAFWLGMLKGNRREEVKSRGAFSSLSLSLPLWDMLKFLLVAAYPPGRSL